jgi:hypothetical protein
MLLMVCQLRLGYQWRRNPLTTINKNNIESISVLKDASATALFMDLVLLMGYYYYKKGKVG